MLGSGRWDVVRRGRRAVGRCRRVRMGTWDARPRLGAGVVCRGLSVLVLGVSYLFLFFSPFSSPFLPSPFVFFVDHHHHSKSTTQRY